MADTFEMLKNEGNLMDRITALESAVESLQRRNTTLSSLSAASQFSGDMTTINLGDQTLDPDGIHTRADMIDVNWYLPVTTADDDLSHTGIWALVYDGSTYVYVGGDFTSIGGVKANYIARYNVTSRNWEEYNSGVNGIVYSIAIDTGGAILIGGAFTDAGGVANADGIAKSSGSTWAALGTGVAAGGIVYAIAVDSANNYYAAGNFSSMGGAASTRGVAKYTSGAWTTSGGTMAVGAIGFALLVDSSDNVYLGSSPSGISGIGGTVSKLTSGTWAAVGTPPSGANVYALALDSTELLYAGGDFTSPVRGVAKYESGTWVGVGDGLDTALEEVRAMLVDENDDLFIFGSFASIGGVAAVNAARWNGTIWDSISSANVTGEIFSAALLDNGTIFIGGVFSSMASFPARNAAIYARPLSDAIDVLASNFEYYAPKGSKRSFTPVVEGSGTAGAGTYTTQTGSYIRHGNIIHFTLSLVWTAHTGTGNLRVSGLPVAPTTDTVMSVFFSNVTLTAVGNKVMALALSSGTIIYLYEIGSGAAAFLPIDTAATLYISGFYFV